eukprot:scaffold189956_cov43-Prasinocladus_malaysianus.AAC.5
MKMRQAMRYGAPAAAATGVAAVHSDQIPTPPARTIFPPYLSDSLPVDKSYTHLQQQAERLLTRCQFQGRCRITSKGTLAGGLREFLLWESERCSNDCNCNLLTYACIYLYLRERLPAPPPPPPPSNTKFKTLLDAFAAAAIPIRRALMPAKEVQ